MGQADKLQERKVFARRKWSAEQLEIPQQASRKDCREQWLRKLEEDDFLPDETLWPCWLVLNSAEVAALAHEQHPGWASSFDQATRQAIDAYAERFFTLDPAERRQQYARLFAASFDNPRLQARLATLAPGLDMPVAADPLQTEDEEAELLLGDVDDLARHFRSLFVLAPAARGRLHLAFLREHSAEMPRWAGAAIQLQESQPEFAALLPNYFEELIAWDVRKQDAARMQVQLDTQNRLQQLETVQQDRAGGSSFFDGWLSNRYTLFFGLMMIVKLLTSLGGSSSSSRAPSYPNIPVADQKAKMEQLLAQIQRQRQEANNRKWIEMKPEEFEALGGPETVQRLGPEFAKKREDYWEWHAKYEKQEAALIAKRAELPALQRRLYDLQQLEPVAAENYEAALQALKLTKSNRKDAAERAEQWKRDHQLLKDEIAQLIEEQDALLQEILRLQIECSAVQMENPLGPSDP